MTLGGINRFKIWNWLAETRTHGEVERHVWTSLREKLVPAATLADAKDPNNPNAVRLDVISALPSEEIILSPAEQGIMLRGMLQFDESPGVPGIDGEWFDQLLKELKGHK